MTQETWETLSERFNDSSFLNPDAPEVQREAERNSQKARIFHMFLDHAVDLGRKNDLDPNSIEAESLIERTHDTEDGLLTGFTLPLQRLHAFDEKS